MQYIHRRQIKAARAMLDWSREDLAAATGLSLSTIRSLEAGTISPRQATYQTILQAVEENGLEFTDREGVRARARDLLLFDGPDSADRFFEDILQTLRQRGGDVRTICPTQTLLTQAIGASDQTFERFEQLSAAALVKCLLSDCHEPLHAAGTIQFRAIAKLQACPSPYFIYGDKLGFVMREGGIEVRFIVIQSVSIARHWGDSFLDLWDSAVPFLTHANAPHPKQHKRPERMPLFEPEASGAENDAGSDPNKRK
jgi:transcriptional regulator with XRE-family HTH domain